VSTAATNAERLVERYPTPVTITTVLGLQDSQDPDTPTDVTPETQPRIKAYKDLFNIDLQYNWIVNSDQYEQKFAAELAAGNLPDVMKLSMSQFEDLYSQGAFADLTDVWAKYSTPVMERLYNWEGTGLQATTKNGKIYGLLIQSYGGAAASQIYYDMTKLKAYGINSYNDLPRTLAEFEGLCEKIHARNPGQPVIPVASNLISGLADFRPVFDVYAANNSAYVDYGTGNLEYAGIHPNFKRALAKLNEWYQGGYFARDFASFDIWASDSPVVNDIVAGKYAIVFGCWWIPNWPLNLHKNADPSADWVVGPTLTENGGQPTITRDRFFVDSVIVISRNCKNPEAVFKMINYDIEDYARMADPVYSANRTPEQRRTDASNVQYWVPWRIWDPSVAVANFNFFHDLEEKGLTSRAQFPYNEAPRNAESGAAIPAYLDYHNGRASDGGVWGFYTSRIAANGGVAKAEELFKIARMYYNEVYFITPSMISRGGPLSDYQNAQVLRMIMGEVPINDFDSYAAQWRALGGSDILREVNEWYHNQ
jgi:ABC-type glycerol-3-phosphate transport system substrate-binding protein